MKKSLIFLFLFFLVVFFLLYLFFLSSPSVIEESSQPIEEKDEVVGDLLGVDNIITLKPPENFGASEIGAPESTQRDDRVYIDVPEDTSEGSLGSSTTPEEQVQRLTRLFVGPTAGYRIDQMDDGSWVVRVVEQGRGDRYIIQTSPYSINLVAGGEFTRVLDAYIFSNDTSLVLYESSGNESLIKSAFVPFAPTDGNNKIQLFEDNIRVATNNENLLFFLKEIDDKTVGLVVNTSNPEDTKIIWESYFSNWLPRWGRNSFITISTPISKLTKGYVYLLDPSEKGLFSRLADIPSGGSLFIDTSSGFFVLYEASLEEIVGKTSITEQTRNVSVQIPSTLPEKCDGFNGVFICAVPTIVPARTLSGYETVFPDSWYQGDIFLQDSLIQVDVVTGGKKLLFSSDQEDIQLLSGGRTFDIIHPRISEDGSLFFFVDKRDMALWVLQL